MYLDTKVKIPVDIKGISKKKIKKETYVYYEFGRRYIPEKKYNVPQCTSIGKVCTDDPEMMYPNASFLKFFPDVELPETQEESERSSCIKTGTFLVLRKLIARYHLEDILRQILGEEAGLFLDLAVYSIITEGNAEQYYPDYAYNHPLFTEGMKVYSDSKVSSFLKGMSRDQGIEFQNAWNTRRDHREKVYISYDSTNKKSEAGDIDLVEMGHSKRGEEAHIINYSVAYDSGNREPLFYEDYPGSIVDISELQHMLDKAAGYGYKHAAFILDRGYFGKDNIDFMDASGYDFVMMVKGCKKLVNSLIAQVRGTFEDDRRYSIRDYRVSGITIESKLYASDRQTRYFHIFYNGKTAASERENLESKIDRMSETLKDREGNNYRVPEGFLDYFEPFYQNEGEENEVFVCARERAENINKDIELCGYFVIVTSEKMTADEAIHLYKSRDTSEKLFRGDKSYLGNETLRIQSNEAAHAKILVEFVALILRNRIYTCLKDYMKQTGKKRNYMTVPAAIRELEKIEMIRLPEGNYRQDHAVTACQKEILAAFGMDDSMVRNQIIKLGKQMNNNRGEHKKWQEEQ